MAHLSVAENTSAGRRSLRQLHGNGSLTIASHVRRFFGRNDRIVTEASPTRKRSAELPKCRAFLQTLGKTLLVSRQPRTHQVMHGGVAEVMHLLHRLFCSPTFYAHAIRRDHHTGPVIA